MMSLVKYREVLFENLIICAARLRPLLVQFANQKYYWLLVYHFDRSIS